MASWDSWFPATDGSWLSLEEGRERAFGAVEWWMCEGLHGERVEERQLRSDGPESRPIWHSGSGKMYLGGWKKHPEKDCYQWHGFGVYCRRDGRVFVGEWDEGKLCGLAKRVWLPSAPLWLGNKKDVSVIRSKQTGEDESVGLPFIYIGGYRGNWKEDKQAIVILKDGTTRTGPWKKNQPVGDWWEDHEKSVMSPGEMARVLSFTRTYKQIAPARSNSTHSTLVESSTGELSSTDEDHEKDPNPNFSAITSHSDEVSESSGSSEEEGSESSGSASEALLLSNYCRSEGIDVNISAEMLRGKASPVKETERTRREHARTIYDKDQVSSFARLLAEEIIGYDANPVEMEGYAPKFLDLGLHSVKMIEEMCTPADVASFTWMKEYHRRRLLSWVCKKGIQNKEPWCRNISLIAEWLEQEAIGDNANVLEMGLYAQSFFNFGFHSVEMIKHICTPNDVASFSWMKPAHKRVFLSRGLPNNYPRKIISV
jgi:hypothetical protein